MVNETLSGKRIFSLYYPLALSWVFMVLDGPISVGVISGLPHARVNTAAFLILMSISMWIESPIIDLLSTSTTLGKDRSALGVINRFALYLNGWVTLAHAIAILSPIYWVLTEGILRVEHEVAVAARPGLTVMIPWAAFIGWRRSRQGLMIRSGQTRMIGTGTMVRACVLVLVDGLLYRYSGLSGVVVAACGLLASVITEALFIHFASRNVIAKLAATLPREGQSLSMRRLAQFHTPLTATTMMKLMTGPVIAGGLARTLDPTRSMAAYEVASTVLFVFRAIAFCLPEVVISLYHEETARPPLRRFSLWVGGVSTGIVLLAAFTRLDVWIFQHLLNAQPDLAEIGHRMFLASSFAPIMDASMSYLLGVLTAHHLTVVRMIAVVGSSLILVGAVVISVLAHWSGAMLAGFSISTGLGAEVLILGLAWLRAKPTVTALTPAPTTG